MRLDISPPELPSTGEVAREALSVEDAAEEPNLYDVFWEGAEDPLNPMHWSARLKWGHILLITLLTFVVSLASSMLAPTIPQTAKDLGTSDSALESFILSAYVIGFSLGPLLVAPLSEIYGRSVIYQTSSVLYMGFSVGCALSSSVGMFVAFRLLTGCVGVTPLALGASSIGDIMPPESMGTPMALFGLGSLLAPMLAPVAGGYLSEAAGWRWIFWVIIIAMGVIIVVSPLLLKESYAPIVLERKAEKLRKTTGNAALKSRLDSGAKTFNFIRNALLRPPKMMFTSPIVLMLSIYVATLYGYQYLMFSTLSYIYQRLYNLSVGKSGLIYLGTGIGTALAVGILGPALDRVASRDKRKGREAPPERCLWPQLIGAFLIPAGLFWYGWSLEANRHPVVPLIGLGVFGFGIMAIFMPLQLYLVSAYGVHSASALAATNVLRNVAGALVPLGGQGLYDSLGNGWGNSLLAFISIACIPVPFLLTRYGGKLRARDRNIVQAG